MMELSAVLFDRDGTLIEDRHYLGSPEGVELVPGTGEALAILRQRGVKSFVVSNQSGIGRGVFSRIRLACLRRKAGRAALRLRGRT